jgi:hypothetical protein
MPEKSQCNHPLSKPGALAWLNDRIGRDLGLTARVLGPREVWIEAQGELSHPDLAGDTEYFRIGNSELDLGDVPEDGFAECMDGLLVVELTSSVRLYISE